MARTTSREPRTFLPEILFRVVHRYAEIGGPHEYKSTSSSCSRSTMFELGHAPIIKMYARHFRIPPSVFFMFRHVIHQTNCLQTTRPIVLAHYNTPSIRDTPCTYMVLFPPAFSTIDEYLLLRREGRTNLINTSQRLERRMQSQL